MKESNTEGNCWKFKFWRLPHIQQLELFYGLDVTYDYPLHMHEDHAVVIMLQGMDITYHRGETHTAQAGELLFVNAGEVHASQSIGTEYRIMNIHPDLISRIGTEVFGGNLKTQYFPKRLLRDENLFSSLLKLHRKLEQKLSPFEQEVEFISTIGFLLKQQNDSQATPKSTAQEQKHVKLVQDYLHCHYSENVTLEQLTSITGLSPYYLIRMFRDHVGVPPHEYQTQLRIAHAKKLLRDGTSILEVALQTGFFDQSHLTRNFKRIVGVTPGQYVVAPASCPRELKGRAGSPRY